MTSEIPKKGCKTPQNTSKRHKMARNIVKCYNFCMGKFMWTGNLTVRLDFKDYCFLGSLITAKTPKKGCKIPQIT